jgi:hypothetical protein
VDGADDSSEGDDVGVLEEVLEEVEDEKKSW